MQVGPSASFFITWRLIFIMFHPSANIVSPVAYYLAHSFSPIPPYHLIPKVQVIDPCLRFFCPFCTLSALGRITLLFTVFNMVNGSLCAIQYGRNIQRLQFIFTIISSTEKQSSSICLIVHLTPIGLPPFIVKIRWFIVYFPQYRSPSNECFQLVFTVC